MEIGSVIFVRGHSLVSSLIQKYDGEFSHVCLALSKDRIIESQRFTKSRIVEFDYSDYEVIPLNLTEDEKYNLLKLSIQLTSYQYDYEKVWGYVLRRIFDWNKPNLYNNRENFLCSELVEILLYGIGKLPIEKNFGDKSPTELYMYLMDKFG